MTTPKLLLLSMSTCTSNDEMPQDGVPLGSQVKSVQHFQAAGRLCSHLVPRLQKRALDEDNSHDQQWSPQLKALAHKRGSLTRLEKSTFQPVKLFDVKTYTSGAFFECVHILKSSELL
jgi:hypothetical protein